MNKIKEILTKKGIKQIWLAKKLGKSYNMVNSYVRNRRQPSLKILFKIANILKIDVRELLKSNLCPNCGGAGIEPYETGHICGFCQGKIIKL